LVKSSSSADEQRASNVGESDVRVQISSLGGKYHQFADGRWM